MNGVVSLEHSHSSSRTDVRKIKSYYNKRSEVWTCDKENSYFTFDFIDKKVKLTDYSLKTPIIINNPELFKNDASWKVEGSNDGNEWVLVDSRKNDFSISVLDSSHVFRCNGDTHTPFRYIRITDMKKCQFPVRYEFLPISIEFFGCLLK